MLKIRPNKNKTGSNFCIFWWQYTSEKRWKINRVIAPFFLPRWHAEYGPEFRVWTKKKQHVMIQCDWRKNISCRLVSPHCFTECYLHTSPFPLADTCLSAVSAGQMQLWTNSSCRKRAAQTPGKLQMTRAIIIVDFHLHGTRWESDRFQCQIELSSGSKRVLRPIMCHVGSRTFFIQTF